MGNDLEEMQAQLDALAAQIAQAAHLHTAATAALATTAPAATEAPTDAGDAEASSEPLAHRVAPGETLESIADAYQTTPEAILAANVGTLVNDNLFVGHTICVPAHRA